MINIIKGQKVTNSTLQKVLQFVEKISPKASINISDNLTCMDIPINHVQIIWENGKESVVGE